MASVTWRERRKGQVRERERERERDVEGIYRGPGSGSVNSRARVLTGLGRLR